MTDMDSRLQMSAYGKDEQRQTMTPIEAEFYKAAAKGRFESFENCGGQLDRILTPNKNTILHIYLSSLDNKSTEFIRKAIDKCPSLLRQTNDNNDTPLHIAAWFDHSEAAEMLIQRAKAPFEMDPESGEEAVVKAREMVRMVNKQKATALHEAARFDSVDVVGAILAVEDLDFTYSANDCGETPLYLAAYFGASRTFLKILDAYNDKPVAYGGPNGKTALHAAVMRNNAKAVDKIVEKMKYLVNEADEYGWTPLHYAAYKEEIYISIVSKLLEVDKTVAYVKDKDWTRTALHIAACRGNASIMSTIISKCPDCCELTDIRGWNVLHYAAINDSDDVLEEVLKIPSIFFLAQAKDINGYTPFHLHLLLYSSDIEVWESRLRKIGNMDIMLRILNSVHEVMNYDSEKEEFRKWTEDLGDGPFGKIFVRKIVRKNWREIEREIEEKTIPELEKAKDAHLVAAALVATVTFAAAFTLPGGFVSGESESKQKQGTPILSANSAFKAFVISDAIAMVLSTASVFIQYIMVMLGYKRKYFWLMSCCTWFTVFAMGAMVVAFVSGTYAVLAPSPGLAITTCLIGLSFFLYVFYAILRLVRANRQWIGYIRYYICDIVEAIKYYIFVIGGAITYYIFVIVGIITYSIFVIVGIITCYIFVIVRTITYYIFVIVGTIMEKAASIRYYICDILETIRQMAASIMY